MVPSVVSVPLKPLGPGGPSGPTIFDPLTPMGPTDPLSSKMYRSTNVKRPNDANTATVNPNTESAMIPTMGMVAASAVVAAIDRSSVETDP